LYVLGFAYGYRFFLGSFGPRARPLSWAGLLLVYQRCFWMGFYNYCLGLMFVWLISGFCVRNMQRIGLRQTIALAIFFIAAFFTHLAAFLIALLAAFGVALWIPPRRIATAFAILAAAAPAILLLAVYFF